MHHHTEEAVRQLRLIGFSVQWTESGVASRRGDGAALELFWDRMPLVRWRAAVGESEAEGASTDDDDAIHEALAALRTIRPGG